MEIRPPSKIARQHGQIVGRPICFLTLFLFVSIAGCFNVDPGPSNETGQGDLQQFDFSSLSEFEQLIWKENFGPINRVLYDSFFLPESGELPRAPFYRTVLTLNRTISGDQESIWIIEHPIFFICGIIIVDPNGKILDWHVPNVVGALVDVSIVNQGNELILKFKNRKSGLHLRTDNEMMERNTVVRIKDNVIVEDVD